MVAFLIICGLFMQYLSLLAFARVGIFSFSGNNFIRYTFAITLFVVSLWFFGLAIGYQSAIPLWLGTISVLGMLLVYQLATYKTLNK